MVTGVVMLASLCIFEIILAEIAIGSATIKEFNFYDFYDIEEDNYE